MNEKISAMPDIVTLNGSDIVPVVRSGDMTNYRASLKEIATFVGSTAGGVVSFSGGSTVDALDEKGSGQGAKQNVFENR